MRLPPRNPHRGTSRSGGRDEAPSGSGVDPVGNPGSGGNPGDDPDNSSDDDNGEPEGSGGAGGSGGGPSGEWSEWLTGFSMDPHDFSFEHDTNGSVAAGLQGLNDEGMKWEDKLPVVNPARIKFVGSAEEAAEAGKEHGGEAYHMILSNKNLDSSRKAIALVSLYTVLDSLGLKNQSYPEAKSRNPKAALVGVCAFAVPYLGLVAYKEIFDNDPKVMCLGEQGGIYSRDDQDVYKPVYMKAEDSFITERDTVDPKYTKLDGVTSCYDLSAPLCDIKHMTAAEVTKALIGMKELKKAGGESVLQSYTTTEALKDAVTVLIATKMNYFQTNHHTGAGQMTHFISKILTGIYPSASSVGTGARSEMQPAAWRVGHWASTHVALNTMGVRTGIRVILHPATIREFAINLADDFKIRVDCPPAGIAKYAILSSVMTMHGQDLMWAACQSIGLIHQVFKAYKSFMNLVKRQQALKLVDERAKSHVGKAYIAGEVSTYAWPCPVEAVPLGAIGSYICNIWPTTTLANTPLLRGPGPQGEVVNKYTGLPGFNTTWDAVCVGAIDRGIDANQILEKFVTRAKATVQVSMAAWVETQVQAGKSASEAVQEYKSLVDEGQHGSSTVEHPLKRDRVTGNILFEGDDGYDKADPLTDVVHPRMEEEEQEEEQ